MKILYKELETLIKENNETYFKLNNLVYEEEQKLSENFESSKLKFQRWQFIHNYAEEISNFILYTTPNGEVHLDILLQD